MSASLPAAGTALASACDRDGLSHVPLHWLLPSPLLPPPALPVAAPTQPEAHSGALCADVPRWWRGGGGAGKWQSGGELFLCVGSEESGLLSLLLTLCCRVASLQQAGRAVRSGLPAFRAAGHRHLDQPVLLLLRAEAEGGRAALQRRLGAMAQREREGWAVVQVREFSSLPQLDGFLLSACWSLPLPPRLVLVDELPAPPAVSDCRQSCGALSCTLQAARQLLDESARRCQQADSDGLLPCQLFLSLQTDSGRGGGGGGGGWLRSTWLPPADALSLATHMQWREIVTAAPLAASRFRLSVLPACLLPQERQAAGQSVDYSRPPPTALEQEDAAVSAAAALGLAAASVSASARSPSSLSVTVCALRCLIPDHCTLTA